VGDLEGQEGVKVGINIAQKRLGGKLKEGGNAHEAQNGKERTILRLGWGGGERGEEMGLNLIMTVSKGGTHSHRVC